MGLGITTVLACGRESCGPSWTRRYWLHEDYAKFYFVLRGTASYDNNAGSIQLVPGVYFLPGHQGSKHACPRSMEVDWMHISIDAPVLDLRLSRLRTIQSWPLAAWSRWEPVYTRLQEFARRKSDELELRIQAMIMHGFADQLERHHESDDPQMFAMRERFEPVLRFMDADFRRNPSLPEMARVAGMSVVHFQRSFTRAFHATPHRYLLRRRMDLAHQLLTATEDSIGAISAACGYDDQFYFSRVFKRWFGTSPERFRADRASRP
ncbi:MAG: helix-turn-helix transcriptional regulator [Planctomycetes bacterium]|nr:helix-turn-helix transcriptional regulator [Planctomycetota bacterium]